MRTLMRLTAVLLLLAALPVRADRAGVFDYYVLSLSWQPTWCALEGRARGAEQCDRGHGWVLHGLWPQYHRGWPAHCQTAQRPPSRSMTAGMADIMGAPGLAWHQWKKHGTCSGLSAPDYFALSRRAYARVNRPAVFRKLSDPVRLPARVSKRRSSRPTRDGSATCSPSPAARAAFTRRACACRKRSTRCPAVAT